MDRAASWLTGTAARWNQTEKTWSFPSGATLTFGYLDSRNDRYRYQSSELQFCGFDELTTFKREDYVFLFSRLRRLKDSHVPLRMRAASNPGGEGHQWVRQRFIVEGDKHGRPFVPAKKEDNPYLDVATYEESLSELDSVTRKRLSHGDWSVQEKGELFDRTWFKPLRLRPDAKRRVRYWDLAATEPDRGTDPDWTAGVLVSESNGSLCIEDVVHVRRTPAEVEKQARRTAEHDGKETVIWIEQEPGASGKSTISHWIRNVLPGFAVYGDTDKGPKDSFWRILSAKAENGLVSYVEGPWNEAFFDELETIPNGDHDDQADAASKGAAKVLRGRAPGDMPIKL
jgi:predicted phage terminase large subunit-like protein